MRNPIAGRESRPPKRARVGVVSVFVLAACVLAALNAAGACGGKIAAVDGGFIDLGGTVEAGGDDATSADAGEDTSDGNDGFVECSYDASEDVPCVPPADDLLFPTPPTTTVAAGGYGFAIFTASGPWTTDPTFFMQYESSTLPIVNFPEVLTFGSPQSILFEVAKGTAGTQGTVTVTAHAGNIQRTAAVSVTITACQPWPPSTVCAPSQNCGYEGDGCGGLLTCGTCTGNTPYCFLGTCQATQPTYCPTGDGLGPGGECIPCSATKTCQECVGGYCTGIEDNCICEPPPHTFKGW